MQVRGAPLRLLAIVPEPIDAPWSSAAASAWRAVEASLQPAVAAGTLEIVRLNPATGNALERQLAGESFNLLHVVGRGTSRPAARYGTLTLEGSDRRTRDLNAHNFARLCAAIDDLGLIVLQTVGDSPTALDVLRDTLVHEVASVVSITGAGGLSGPREVAEVVRALYLGLLAGQPIEAAFAMAAGDPRASGTSGSTDPSLAGVRLFVRDQPSPRQTGRSREVPLPVQIARPLAPLVPDRNSGFPADANADACAREITRKRAAGDFDVFLCHNVDDKPAVIDIARRLLGRGVLPWVDAWELRPGIPWQHVLEEQIAHIRAAAVFVGRVGIGPWQRHEVDAWLCEFNKRSCPVIPVLLSGAVGEPELPIFLRGMTWVDFRVADPDPLNALMWGITGTRPGDP